MNLHEGRLRAMTDPDSLAGWELNVEDREAIRWALDAIGKLKAERDGLREEYGRGMHESYERWNAARAVAGQLADLFDVKKGEGR